MSVVSGGTRSAFWLVQRAGWLVFLGSFVAACHPHPGVAGPEYRGPGFALILAAGDESVAVRMLLQEAERLLPPQVKQTIARPVAISFAPGSAAATLPLPTCQAEEASSQSLVQQLGEVRLAENSAAVHQVFLHPELQNIAAVGNDRAPTFPCGHRSLYRLAVATIIHEVVHIYDALTQLSKNPRYAHLQRFEREGALRRLKPQNQLRVRSPDIYEFASISENLAVNLEYFLLDPEYKCRRPAVYQFLSAQLQHEPFREFACAVNTLVFSGGQPQLIDPTRVYQIHYLFAVAGTGLASRWGHAMFRLIRCAPTRVQVDEKCLEDLHDHVVMSFVANLQDDLAINAWKGLTGGYISQLTIRPFSEVLNDYTELQFRDLQSLPMRLTAAERQQFIYHALELYWSYRGQYYFIGNNCASESLQLIQSSLTVPTAHGIRIVTPRGLRDELIQRHLADDSVLANPDAARQKGYLFRSARQRYSELFANLRPALPAAAPHELMRYLSKTTAASRLQWASAALPDARSLAMFFTLEGLILNLKQKEIERAVIVNVKFKQRPRYLAIGQQLRAHLRSLRLPWELVAGGYGIPLMSEFAAAAEQAPGELPSAFVEATLALIQVDYPVLYAEFVQVRQNRQSLLAILLDRAARNPPLSPYASREAGEQGNHP